jgi:hydrogenase maturation protease
VGNEFRSDDGIGPWIARELKRRGIAADVMEASGEGTHLMSLWSGHDRVVVIDAMQSGAAPGTIQTFDAIAAPLPAECFTNTSHDFGVAQAIELARVLGQLPPALTVHGIEGADFSAGLEMTPAVREAGEALVSELLKP